MEAEEFTIGNPNGASASFYNGARWYQPQWGRYTQPDPISYNGSPFNLYSYAGNNPIELTDRSGEGAAFGTIIGASVCIETGLGMLACAAAGAILETLIDQALHPTPALPPIAFPPANVEPSTDTSALQMGQRGYNDKTNDTKRF